MSLPDDYIYRVDLVGVDSGGTTNFFSYATTGYCTISGAGNSLIANAKFIDGRVRQITYQADMYGDGGTVGDPAPGHGEVVLGNEDGGLDALLSYGFDNQRIEIWRIDPANLASETCEFRGLAEQFTMSIDSASVLIRDFTFVAATPLQTAKYAGTNVLPNGLEGMPDDLGGKPKPKCIGVNYNIKLPLVNTSRLIYQINDTQINAAGFTIAVRDMGVALTRGADYVSQVDMETNAPAAGGFRVWSDSSTSKGSFIRLGSTPVGQLTADVTNPPISGNAGCEWWRCFTYLLPIQGGTWTLDNRITTVGSSSAGFFWSEETTVYDAMREVLRCVNGTMQVYPVTTPTGGLTGPATITVQRLTVPTATVDLDLDQTNINDIQRIVPSDDMRGIPAWRFQVGWKRNRTVLSRDELAGSVTDANVTFYGSEYRYVKRDNAATLLRYPRAQVLQLDTALTDDPTTDLAVYLATLFQTANSVWLVNIPMSLVDALVDTTGGRNVFGITFGKQVRITYPRFNLNSGQMTMVIGYVKNHAERTVDLLLWSQP
jgi:hypothetical protein